MARKIKIDNATLKRLAQRKESEERIAETREPRKFFLIVCEGGKTEPNYFNALASELPKGLVTVEIVGVGDNTTSLVEKACEHSRKSCTKFDKKWVVFDKDDFTAESFNTAIFNAESNGFFAAYSNEAFELWYLLHFEYCNAGISRHQYSDKLSEYFGVEYRKNDPAIYELLRQKGNQKKAIAWAEKLYTLYDHKSPATENPSTTVHLLVMELNKYKVSANSTICDS